MSKRRGPTPLDDPFAQTMRIAFCIFQYFPFGGLQRDSLRIAKECLRRGHSVHFITREWQGDRPEGLEITTLDVTSKTNHGASLEFSKRAVLLLQEGGFDLVVGFNKMPGLDLYFCGDHCFKIASENDLGVFSRFIPRYRTYLQLEEAVFLDPGTEILHLTPRAREELHRAYQTPPDRFHLIPPGAGGEYHAEVDEEEQADFNNEFEPEADDLILIFAGGYFKRKGLDRALRGVAALPLELKQRVQLLVLGEDRAGRAGFEKLAKRLHVERQTRFLGYRNDAPRFFRHANLLIHPARLEVAGMIIPEALVSGLPVLTTENTGYSFHVSRADAGLVLPQPFDQEALNHALNELLASDRRLKMRSNALQYASRSDLRGLAGAATDVIERLERQRHKSHPPPPVESRW